MEQLTAGPLLNDEERLLYLLEQLAALHGAPDLAWLAGRFEFLGERALGASATVLALADECGGFKHVSSGSPRPVRERELLATLGLDALDQNKGLRAALRVAELSARPLAISAADLFPNRNVSNPNLEFLVVALVHDRELIGGALFAVTARPLHEAMVSALAIHAAVAVDQLRQREAARRLHSVDRELWVPDQDFLLEQLRREVSRARRHGREVGIAYFRVKNDPEVRASIGDFRASHLLRRIGSVLLGNVRDTDVLGAFEGGYAVIHTDTSFEGTVVSARRLADAIRSMAERRFPDTPALDVSICCAAYPSDGDSVEELTKHLCATSPVTMAA